MAKLRSVDTKFWDDRYIRRLEPRFKLLFLYLLTSPLCNLAGVYEIGIDRIAFDTGLDEAFISTALQRFEDDKKLIYKDEYIIMLNHHKHQNINKSMEVNILRTIDALPVAIQQLYNTACVQAVDTLPTPCRQDKDKDKDKGKGKGRPTLEQRIERFRKLVYERAHGKGYKPTMVDAFITYWSETNERGRTMRWEMQPTFNIAGRLSTWARRERPNKAKGAARNDERYL